MPDTITIKPTEIGTVIPFQVGLTSAKVIPTSLDPIEVRAITLGVGCYRIEARHVSATAGPGPMDAIVKPATCVSEPPTSLALVLGLIAIGVMRARRAR